MDKHGRIVGLLWIAVCIAAPGCSITLGPEKLPMSRATEKPLLQLGEVTETFTGTWVREARANGSGFKPFLIRALGGDEAGSLFSSDPSSMTMRLHLVSNHESDAPRLLGLGCLSMMTLGIIPLKYYSEWNVQCRITILSPDGIVIAKYPPIHETGSYKIWAFPLTMFTLFGASFRGSDDAREMSSRIVHNLSAKIMKTVRSDYARLARWQESLPNQGGRTVFPVQLGKKRYWLRYSIARAKPRRGRKEPPRQLYVLDIYRNLSDVNSGQPYRRVAIAERRGGARAEPRWQWYNPQSVIFYAERRLWHPEWKAEGSSGKLVSVKFKERPVSAEELFSAEPFGGLSADDLNSLLLSWKNRELGALLQEARTRELRDHVDRIEHMILKANEATEEEKDKAQQLIMKGAAGADRHAQTARKYRSRIEILKPILAAIKEEIGNREK